MLDLVTTTSLENVRLTKQVESLLDGRRNDLPQGQSQNQQQSSATIQSPHFPWSQPTPQPLQEQREETQFFNVPQTSATATQPQQERGVKAPTIIDGVFQPRRQPPNDNRTEGAQQEGGREETNSHKSYFEEEEESESDGEKIHKEPTKKSNEFQPMLSGRRRR